jgi:hypothetical protein
MRRVTPEGGPVFPLRALTCVLLLLITCIAFTPQDSGAQFSSVVAVPGNKLSAGYWVEKPGICGLCPPGGLTGCRAGVLVYGEYFHTGARVELRRASTVIRARPAKVLSPCCISCVFDLKGASPGAWDVLVVNPDGGSCSLPGGFQVIGCAPRGVGLEEGGEAGTPGKEEGGGSGKSKKQ